MQIVIDISQFVAGIIDPTRLKQMHALGSMYRHRRRNLTMPYYIAIVR